MTLGGLSFLGVKEAVSAAVRARLGRAARDWNIDLQIVAGGARGGRENALIARAQARMGRAAFGLDARWLTEIRRMVAALGGRPARDADLLPIGRRAIEGVLDNVARQREVSGRPFRSLTEPYARQKLRRHGFIRPILRATGDLLDGMHVRISRR